MNTNEICMEMSHRKEDEPVLSATSSDEKTKLHTMVTKQCNNSDEENKECAICLDEQGVGDFARPTACSHYFHHKCMIRWYVTRKKTTFQCPYCKTNSYTYEKRNGDVMERVPFLVHLQNASSAANRTDSVHDSTEMLSDLLEFAITDLLFGSDELFDRSAYPSPVVRVNRQNAYQFTIEIPTSFSPFQRLIRDFVFY